MTAQPGLILEDDVFYPHSFTVADLGKFHEFVRTFDRLLLFHEVAIEGTLDTDALAIRHDVDHSAVHALRFAEWEALRGIRSTYFLLPTAPYYRDAEGRTVATVARAIQNLGHEVGVHNDSFTTAGGDPDAAIALLTEWTNEMREWGIDVHGCADHGGGEPNNTLLWRLEMRLPQEAGLEYEAYLLHQQHAHYLSDSGGYWHEPLGRVEGRQTHVLVHPEHWFLP